MAIGMVQQVLATAPPSSRPRCRPPSAAAAPVAPSRRPSGWPSSSCQRRRFGGSRVMAAGAEAGMTSSSTVVALPEEAAAELGPEGGQQWAACADLLRERCGLEGEAANAVLLKAFGWKGQGFWRQERVKDAPEPAQVEAALDFLAGLGLVDPDDAGKLVAAFPEAVGLRVGVMEDNVQVLRNKWSMKGNVLLNAIKRKPRVLGNCIDCEGNCAGLCTRCWAQF